MKINTRDFREHLQYISLGGLLPDVALERDFSALAINENVGVLVDVPAFPTEEPLPQSIGLLDIKKVIQSLGALPDTVDLSVGDGRLHLRSAISSISLVTCAPIYVSTHKDADYLQKVKEAVDTNIQGSVDLHENTVAQYKTLAGLVPSETTEIAVGEWGIQFMVGAETQNEASVVEEKPVDIVDFNVRVSTKVLLATFAAINMPVIEFTGEDSLIRVSHYDTDVEPTYILSPVEE